VLAGGNHLPYLPFPPTWPVYIPGKKLANWLESYASILELPVWTSADVSQIAQDGSGWTMVVERPEGRRVVRAKHVVFAVGRAGKPLIPAYSTLASHDHLYGCFRLSYAATEGVQRPSDTLLRVQDRKGIHWQKGSGDRCFDVRSVTSRS
jgi:hypothetical protein